MYATADADDDMSVSFTRAVGEGSVLISKIKKIWPCSVYVVG